MWLMALILMQVEVLEALANHQRSSIMGNNHREGSNRTLSQLTHEGGPQDCLGFGFGNPSTWGKTAQRTVEASGLHILGHC